MIQQSLVQLYPNEVTQKLFIIMDIILRIVMLSLLVFSIGITGEARDAEAKLNLQYVGHGDDHGEIYAPADEPDVYFNSDMFQIIVVADGFASYYDVDIVSQSTMQLVFYTTIGGYGDSIDVSSLPDDNYTIIITSSNNNEYVGQFTNY